MERSFFLDSVGAHPIWTVRFYLHGLTEHGAT